MKSKTNEFILIPKTFHLRGMHTTTSCSVYLSRAKTSHLHVLENLPLSVVDDEGTVALDEGQLKDHGLPRHPEVTRNNLVLAAVVAADSSRGVFSQDLV